MATEKQREYARGITKGLDRRESAILAGYDETTKLSDIEAAAGAQEALQQEIEEARRDTGITKEYVADLLKEAANMARLLEDPTALIAAARELGKMHGLYAPEVKKNIHELGEKTIALLENLPDSELRKIAGGRVIQGEFKRLPDAPAEQ